MAPISLGVSARLLAVCLLAAAVPPAGLRAQVLPDAPADQAVAPEEDALGRSTPRGTVLGFLNASRKEENALARQYLNSQLGARAEEELARQLFVVLDARLPARLEQLSDQAEGSRSNPLSPDQEIVGTIESSSGPVEIVVERVKDRSGYIWLFSRGTLAATPPLYAEVTESPITRALPRALIEGRLAGIRLVEWLVVLIGLPIFYLATVVLNKLLTPLLGLVWRGLRKAPDTTRRNVLPIPGRLLLLAVASNWLLSRLPLSLMLRQLISTFAGLVAIVSIVWLFILLTGEVEKYVRRRFPRTNVPAAVSLLRVVRRAADLLAVFLGMLAMLRRFGVDPTPMIAGLGVGGLAVALAAQRTLENVIAGASLIFDQAVRVGDFLRVGEIQGTVDYIGLRSTRIRTLDRTVVIVPNSQIAAMSLETLSARDKFWFHPVIRLRYETSAVQLRAAVEGIRRLLVQHPAVEVESVRVRFNNLGTFALDVDVFAYVRALDWNDFLEIQEQLLFGVTDAVSKAGAQLAQPPQPVPALR